MNDANYTVHKSPDCLIPKNFISLGIRQKEKAPLFYQNNGASYRPAVLIEILLYRAEKQLRHSSDKKERFRLPLTGNSKSVSLTEVALYRCKWPVSHMVAAGSRISAKAPTL
jgi:hypothetical protein